MQTALTQHGFEKGFAFNYACAGDVSGQTVSDVALPSAYMLRLPPVLRIAVRELQGGLRGFYVFIACLAVGVMTIAGVGSFARGLADGLAREGRVILGADVSHARVLDLFAGSGALAIEALSRGAGEATLVDSSAAAISAIRRNLKALGLEAEVVRAPALRFLEGARNRARQYDLVFLDPPYRHAPALEPELTAALQPLLAGDARVVTESDRRTPLRLGLQLLDERRYGDTLIHIHGT